MERKATAVIEAVRKWAYFLHGRTFCFVTDQRSGAFMLDPLKGINIKNNKILLWREELGTFSYRVEHPPGVEMDFHGPPVWQVPFRDMIR